MAPLIFSKNPLRSRFHLGTLITRRLAITLINTLGSLRLRLYEYGSPLGKLNRGVGLYLSF